MTLQELQEKLVSDLKIDPSNLLEETADNLRKHAWYFNQLINHRAAHKKLSLELRNIEKERYNFYAGVGPNVYEYNLDNRAIKYNLEGDHVVISKHKEMTMVELKIEFFLKSCDLMKDRGFAIKNQIDLLKFQSGA